MKGGLVVITVKIVVKILMLIWELDFEFIFDVTDFLMVVEEDQAHPDSSRTFSRTCRKLNVSSTYQYRHRV